MKKNLTRQIPPIEAFEAYETEYCDDFGFRVFAKKLRPDYVPQPEPEPASPQSYENAKLALEAASGGKNTLLFDDIGLPSVMVRIPMFRWSDVFEDGAEEPCSAFVVGGKTLDSIYISKYLNVVEHGRAYSLPGRNPASMYELDEAREICARKGPGWHILTNAEWMAIAHWCRKNGRYPRGNNASGADFHAPHERGVVVDAGSFADKFLRPVLTGSGPDAWSHDGTPYGIFDLNGNLWDMVSGLRLSDGEIQIIPDNDSALNVDESTGSDAWRAITPDGTLVEPGTPGTFKFDGVNPGHEDEAFVNIDGGVKLSTEIRNPQYFGNNPDTTHRAYSMFFFTDLSHEPDCPPHPILKQIGVYPAGADIEETMFFLRNYGERMTCRGGSWFDGPMAGMWELYMRETRAWIAQDIGFRSAYVPLPSTTSRSVS